MSDPSVCKLQQPFGEWTAANIRVTQTLPPVGRHSSLAGLSLRVCGMLSWGNLEQPLCLANLLTCC